MSETRFDKAGKRVSWSEKVEAVQVFEVSGRRGPQSPVYGVDGTPLIVSRDVTSAELREAAPTIERFRLDPLDKDSNHLENEPSAYVVLPESRLASTTVAPSSAISTEARLLAANVELTRQSFELASQVATLSMTQAQKSGGTALYYAGDSTNALQPLQLVEVMRSRDGSRRDRDDDDDDEDDEDDDQEGGAPPAAPLSPSGGALIVQVLEVLKVVGPTLRTVLGNYPQLAALFGSVAPAENDRAPTSTKPERGAESSTATTARASASTTGPNGHTRAKPTAEPVAETTPSSATTTDEIPLDGAPEVSPSAMLHALQIQQALTPTEQEKVQGIAGVMTDGERAVWLSELARLDVGAGVAKVREFLASTSTSKASTAMVVS